METQFEQQVAVNYNVVRKFRRQFAMNMGKRSEVIYSNLPFEEAQSVCSGLNVYELDDVTDSYFVQPC
jgi:hypothetical protein